MRRTRAARRRTSESQVSLDSLVDVVTNTNGMLILLAVFTTVMAMGKTYEVSYPIVRKTQKNPVFLECRSNRVLLVARDSTVSEHYEETFVGSGFAMVLREGEHGESGQAIRQPDSELRELIADLDPASEYAAFLVRPDSFEVFRAAREVLWEHRAELEIGWEPLPQEGLFALGSRGRSIDTQ